MGICDKLSKHLYMLIYIYLNVDECWLISSIDTLSYTFSYNLFKYMDVLVLDLNFTIIHMI